MAIILTDWAVKRLINEELEKRNYPTRDEINALAKKIENISGYDDTTIKNELETIKNQLLETTENASLARAENLSQAKQIELLAAQFDEIDLNKIDADTIDGKHIVVVTEDEFKALEEQAKIDGVVFPHDDIIYIVK